MERIMASEGSNVTPPLFHQIICEPVYHLDEQEKTSIDGRSVKICASATILPQFVVAGINGK